MITWDKRQLVQLDNCKWDYVLSSISPSLHHQGPKAISTVIRYSTSLQLLLCLAMPTASSPQTVAEIICSRCPTSKLPSVQRKLNQARNCPSIEEISLFGHLESIVLECYHHSTMFKLYCKQFTCCLILNLNIMMKTSFDRLPSHFDYCVIGEIMKA